jgi:hypothetical protein
VRRNLPSVSLPVVPSPCQAHSCSRVACHTLLAPVRRALSRPVRNRFRRPGDVTRACHFGSARRLPFGRYQARCWHVGATQMASATFVTKADALAGCPPLRPTYAVARQGSITGAKAACQRCRVRGPGRRRPPSRQRAPPHCRVLCQAWHLGTHRVYRHRRAQASRGKPGAAKEPRRSSAGNQAHPQSTRPVQTLATGSSVAFYGDRLRSARNTSCRHPAGRRSTCSSSRWHAPR